MRSLGLFVVVILLAIAFAGIGVYYLIPGIYHILIFSISDNPYTYHLKHALLFFALSVAALISARYVQPLPPEKVKTRRLTEEEAYMKARRPKQSDQ